VLQCAAVCCADTANDDEQEEKEIKKHHDGTDQGEEESLRSTYAGERKRWGREGEGRQGQMEKERTDKLGEFGVVERKDEEGGGKGSGGLDEDVYVTVASKVGESAHEIMQALCVAACCSVLQRVAVCLQCVDDFIWASKVDQSAHETTQSCDMIDSYL